MEVSVEVTCVEAFTEASVEITFRGILHEKLSCKLLPRKRRKLPWNFHGGNHSFHESDESFRGSNGSFHELPPKMQIVQVAQPNVIHTYIVAWVAIRDSVRKT